MNGSVVTLACLWVIAAAVVALLPRRWQYLPGLALLVAAGWLMWRLAGAYGAWVVLPALVVVVSMFRRPLAVLLCRILRGPGTGQGARQEEGSE
ncbi:DUF2484 family protein [Roseovarius amoyensis]|uniref:DUF2484 family protein n=1 Tax=Roseovarius amoyensis TaxID=2211448 RepID=UPI000DBE2564|nr:DUF2484 family protein [Roseovarius amoyensis]